MQNKYFGDIHDFYKYNFLQQISIDNSLGIHWCLVPDEILKNDGEIKLSEKEKKINQELYEILLASRKNNNRNVQNIEKYLDDHISKGVKYFTELHTPDCNEIEYEEKAVKHLSKQDFIFFDPDNGIEVASMTHSKKYKYISYRILQRFWNMGKSLIIYQHNDRVKGGLDKKIERLYNLLNKEPNINIVKRGNVNYICVVNASTKAEYYIVLDNLAQLQNSKNYKVENWRGTGGIC